MLTIDASVWVSADSPTERDYAASRAFLDRISASITPIIVPTLLSVEVAAAISRTRNDSSLARDYVDKLIAIPFIQWVPLDATLATRAVTLAAEHRLRGADAVYAAVAIAFGCDLVSLDHQHLTRLPAILRVFTPSQAAIQNH